MIKINLLKRKEKKMDSKPLGEREDRVGEREDRGPGAVSPSFSPVIKEVINERLMNFPQAIQKVIEGRKVTRIYWKNARVYGALEDNILKIHLADGRIDGWILSDGDLKAEDWLEI